MNFLHPDFHSVIMCAVSGVCIAGRGKIMLKPLDHGKRVVVKTNTATRKARLMAWEDHGCMRVSCPDAPPEQGTPVEVVCMIGTPRILYFMQVEGHSRDRRPSLLLCRNPAHPHNLRRRNWRVPFTAVTGLRRPGATHFLGARCVNISMRAACVVSEAGFAVGDSLEMRLTLPGCPDHHVPANVVRALSEAAGNPVASDAAYRIVVRFAALDSTPLRDLTYFLWRRIRETYPTTLRQIFETTQRRA